MAIRIAEFSGEQDGALQNCIDKYVPDACRSEAESDLADLLDNAIEDVRSEAYESGNSDGRDSGYDEGFEAGKESGEDE